MFGLEQRQLKPERMDDPSLGPVSHHAALRGLARINRVSRSAEILWPAISTLARRDGSTPLRILDVATGGGDVPIAIARRARRTGLRVEMHACDLSATALRYAASRAIAAGVGVEFFQADVLKEPLPCAYDVVMSSLFLHHLERTQAVHVLRTLADATRGCLLINDLRRCTAGYVAAIISTRVLSRSPIVHFDGPQSVRAAFTIAEAAEIAASASLSGSRIVPRFPFRWLLEWRRA